MTKSDLIREVARTAGLSHKVSETVVTGVFERIAEALVNGERVELRGLGIFEVRQRRARIGWNPRMGAHVDISGRKVPFFKMGKELLATLNPRGAPEKVPA